MSEKEKLAQEGIDLLNEAADLLTGIKDRASAAAAAERLKAVAKRLRELNANGVPLGSEVHENRQALGRLAGDMEKAVQRYANAAIRVLAQENVLGNEIQEGLRELGRLPQ